MTKATKTNKPGILYCLFKAYLRFFHDRIYYRRMYCLKTENIPPDGTPLLIVSNHQNCLNDPLGILFAFRDRKPYFITRADIFTCHPLCSRFLHAIGLLPAFRIDFEGEAALGKNEESFRRSERELVNGRTVVMYPESGHQDKRWLGDFSFGYTRLAFEAAEMSHFRTEIFILPACNHYSDYFHIREQMLVKFGTPVSLQPYYELYRTKPRTAQRQVNLLVRRQIEDLMLDIRDLDNYTAIDFLRNTYGSRYAAARGFDAQKLPERLQADRTLTASLQAKYAADPETVQALYRDALTVQEGIRALKTDDRLFDRPVCSWTVLVARGAILLALLPLWVFSLWPGALHFVIPALILRRMTDKMFYGTFLYAASILITIPLFHTLTFVLTWIYAGLWTALLYTAALPFIGLFAWDYRKFFLDTRQAWHHRRRWKTEQMQTLKQLRDDLYRRLDDLLTKKETIE
ncbi:MAG: 1-acyl-sn-glycerol-3-phosphate acyltransferase [Tannerella sp.]|nr:1-acyl-sn-glycerol-3-phosphate acyltransferase [Tannerella sp.]